MAQIGAVIAAAGRSRRMGEPKQLLPWGDRSVIATVVANLAAAGADPVLCITGHQADALAKALQGSAADLIHNAAYAESDMLRSYQIGINALVSRTEVVGTLLALGDQPHIPIYVLQQLVEQAQQTPDRIVIPSFQMRRGHPFYFPRCFWGELLALGVEETMRVLMKQHEAAIAYVNVDTDTILRDMDTPEAYQALRLEFAGVGSRE